MNGLAVIHAKAAVLAEHNHCNNWQDQENQPRVHASMSALMIYATEAARWLLQAHGHLRDLSNPHPIAWRPYAEARDSRPFRNLLRPRLAALFL